jgi:hypothetical protein
MSRESELTIGFALVIIITSPWAVVCRMPLHSRINIRRWLPSTNT